MTAKKAALVRRLHKLWAAHDRMERQIIRLERKFTDAELERLLER